MRQHWVIVTRPHVRLSLLSATAAAVESRAASVELGCQLRLTRPQPFRMCVPLTHLEALGRCILVARTDACDHLIGAERVARVG